MWIGHQFERTARGDLHIHSRNLLLAATLLLLGGMCLALPALMATFALAEQDWPPASLSLLQWLVVVSGMWVLIILGAMLLWSTTVIETLRLSRNDNLGEFTTRNIFWRTRQSRPSFALANVMHLELRRRKDGLDARTHLWMLMHDGSEQQLTPENVVVQPGKECTERWLRELTDYLNVPMPELILENPEWPGKPGTAASSRDTSPIETATARREGSDATILTAPEKKLERIDTFLRIISGSVGIFMIALALLWIEPLFSALFDGWFRVGVRNSGSLVLDWATQPIGFSLSWLAGLIGQLMFGAMGSALLYAAIVGKIKSPG